MKFLPILKFDVDPIKSFEVNLFWNEYKKEDIKYKRNTINNRQ